MSDITNNFRASVKIVRLRNKHSKQDEKDTSENRISPHSREKCQFVALARSILADITKLRHFLVTLKKKYVDVTHTFASSASMPDSERDRIDAQTEKAIKKIGTLLANLRQGCAVQSGEQQRDHHRAIVALLDVYMKSVTLIYSEQRAVRVKRSQDTKRLAFLSSLVRELPSYQRGVFNSTLSAQRLQLPSANAAVSQKSTSQESLASSSIPVIRKVLEDVQRKEEEEEDVDWNVEGWSVEDEEEQIMPTSSKSHSSNYSQKTAQKSPFVTVVNTDNNYEEDHQQQQPPMHFDESRLQQENAMLHRRVTTAMDEIQHIESKVTEIARLQEVFSSKVLEQEKDVEHVYEHAVHTTENMKYGNEQLREAMQAKAGLRVWILFFLLVMSFTLVFLDWYNP